MIKCYNINIIMMWMLNFRERPRINTSTIDVNALRHLPDGIFGKEYTKFLDKNVGIKWIKKHSGGDTTKEFINIVHRVLSLLAYLCYTEAGEHSPIMFKKNQWFVSEEGLGLKGIGGEEGGVFCNGRQFLEGSWERQQWVSVPTLKFEQKVGGGLVGWWTVY